MSFSTDMDKALNGLKASQKTAVKSAFTTFQTAIAAEQTTYGTKPAEKIAFDERLMEIGRELAAQIK